MNRLISKVTVVAVALLAVGLVASRPKHQPSPVAAHAGKAALQVAKPVVKAVPVLSVDLAAAVEQRIVEVNFRGNGRDKMSASVSNKSAQPLRVHVAEGQTLEAGTNLVVVVRGCHAEIRAGATEQIEFGTAAVSSANKVTEASYSLSVVSTPKLEPLLVWLPEHPEVSTPAVQTAVLALMENLPVSAFAKFARINGDLESQFDTSAFRVDVNEIISALIVLREIGVPESQLALTIDPQLKLEAMIDPLTHAAAMRYYSIAPETEWAFWKDELLQGNPSTRHYALYGIARFYPEVAMQMLPKWVRETRTTAVFRISAVQALAETRRPEAISVLRQLEHEVGFQTELGKAAHVAAEYLDKHLNNPVAAKLRVGFRTSQNMPPMQSGAQRAVIASAN